MSSNIFNCIGPRKILAYLRGDVRIANESLLVVGPWIDDYFAEQIVLIAPTALKTRVLIRPQFQVDSYVWERMIKALAIFHSHWPQFEARTLPGLHAKCICIDGQLIFLGSANWYRYSLEESVEVVLRGPLAAVKGLSQDFEALWQEGEPVATAGLVESPSLGSSEGITHEVLDPLAARALRDNPKAFRLGKKSSQL